MFFSTVLTAALVAVVPVLSRPPIRQTVDKTSVRVTIKHPNVHDTWYTNYRNFASWCVPLFSRERANGTLTSCVRREVTGDARAYGNDTQLVFFAPDDTQST